MGTPSGKRSAHGSTRQDAANGIALSLARRLLRLSGGGAFVFLLALPLGCGGGSPVFETVDAAPTPEKSDDLEEVSTPSLDIVPSARPYEEALQSLFLALGHGDQEQLTELLTPDALLRRGSGASSDPALSELLQLSSSAEMEAGTAKGVAISHYKIRELSPEGSPPLAVIDVFGSEPVAGTWRVRFAAGPNPQIAEIMIPAAQ